MPRMKSFLQWIGVAVLSTTLSASAAHAVGTGKDFKGPVGLQLYSLRADAAKNVDMALDEAHDFGFKYVELAGTYNMTPQQLRAALEKRGLKAVSAHYPYSKYKDDPESVAKEAKELGLKYAGCAWADHTGAYTLDQAKQTVEVFNNAGKVLAKHGIRFFYHCHGFEFAPNGNETFMDYLIQNTDPKYVAFEMDIFWVFHPGQDPAKWLEKYCGRWELMHVKDMRQGTERGKFTGGTDVKNDVAIGAGMINIAETLKEAKKCGVKYYFIEDESPSVKEQIPVSLKNLSEIKF
jgi:sugar phosphate isomerase/epimerase